MFFWLPSTKFVQAVMIREKKKKKKKMAFRG